MYLYICVDPWEVGEPGLCRVRRCGKQRGDMSTRGSTKKSLSCFLESVSSCESLNSVRTYVRLVCEWGHRDPAIDGLCGVDARFDLRPDRIRQLVAPNVAAVSEAPIKGLIAGLAVAFGG